VRAGRCRQIRLPCAQCIASLSAVRMTATGPMPILAGPHGSRATRSRRGLRLGVFFEHKVSPGDSRIPRAPPNSNAAPSSTKPLYRAGTWRWNWFMFHPLQRISSVSPSERRSDRDKRRRRQVRLAYIRPHHRKTTAPGLSADRWLLRLQGLRLAGGGGAGRCIVRRPDCA